MPTLVDVTRSADPNASSELIEHMIYYAANIIE